MKVSTLLKILSKYPELYDELMKKETFWKSIYLTFYPYANVQDLSHQSLMQKLCIMPQFYIYHGNGKSEGSDEYEDNEYESEDEKIDPSFYHMIDRTNRRQYTIGKLLMNTDIKRICINSTSILVLNENKEVVEYYVPSGQQLDNHTIHQNRKILFTNVKEMLNFETMEMKDDENEVHDHCVMILTYSGELFFHLNYLNLSYSARFDVEYLKDNYGININRVLNIQHCDNTSLEMAFELEDHRIYTMDVSFLHSVLIEADINEQIIVQEARRQVEAVEAGIEPEIKRIERMIGADGLPLMRIGLKKLEEKMLENRSKILSVKYAKEIDSNAISSTLITELIPETYFTQGINNGKNTIVQLVDEVTFEEEKDLTFDQKIRRKSPRIFAVYQRLSQMSIVFHFDKHFEENVLKLSSKNLYLDEDDDEEESKKINLYSFDSISMFNVQQLSVIISFSTLFGVDMPYTPEVRLQIKANDEFYWLIIEKSTNINFNGFIPVVNQPIINQEHLNEDQFTPTEQVENQPIIDEDQFTPTEQADDQPSHIESSFITSTAWNAPLLRIIDEIKTPSLTKLTLPENLRYKEIFNTIEGEVVYALTSNGKFLINFYGIAMPMIMNADRGYGDINIEFSNVSRIINYKNHLNRHDCILRVNENEYIFVPESHYRKYKSEGRIEREMISNNSDILFNLIDSPYNYRVCKE